MHGENIDVIINKYNCVRQCMSFQFNSKSQTFEANEFGNMNYGTS